MAAAFSSLLSSHAAGAQGSQQATGTEPRIVSVEEVRFPHPRGTEFIPAVRPGMLAEHIESFAGQTLRVPSARVIGVLAPNVLLIDSQAEWFPLKGHRARVLVLLEHGALRVPPALLVGSTVTVFGVARTLLGVQVTREVPWPTVLTREEVERLEIKAAVLARSLRTADGVDLMDTVAPPR